MHFNETLSRYVRRYLYIAIPFLLVFNAARAWGQTCDSTMVTAIRKQTDSTKARHLSPSSAHNVRTNLLQGRIDSIAQRWCLAPPAQDSVASVSVVFDYTTGPLWPGGHVGSFVTPDSVTVCAAVQIGTTWNLGDPAVTVRYHAPDSISWTPKIVDGPAALRTSCAAAWPHGALNTANLVPVRWRSLKRAMYTIAYPFPEPVVPDG